ncbi:MAG TPA: oxygenase MpaB family protein [Dehalococcoidia bacterium]
MTAPGMLSAPQFADPLAPFFPQGAAIRRIHSEGIILFGGGRALLMQVAHPKVAAGVAEHSSFRDGKRRRLLRTLQPTLAIVFGTQAQALQAAAVVNAVHARVRGDGYRADDPELLFWVLATLIDTALFMHERFLGPVGWADQEAYYQDMLAAGELLGVRRDLAPADIGGFREYMASMVPALQVTDAARGIAADLFDGRGATWTGGVLLREMTAALLPPSLREAYAMPTHVPAPDVVAGAVRAMLRLTPRVVRQTPAFLLPAGARL